MKTYLEANLSHHDKAFKGGYGIRYPESHVIRTYEKVLKYELKIDGSHKEKFLDFGCGNGLHADYYRSKGFQVYGVDSDAVAIERCKESYPEIASHFDVIEPRPEAAKTFFGGGFSAVLANHVFYYLSNDDLNTCLKSLHRSMRPGGAIIATMMGKQHYFYGKSKPAASGLREVKLSGRVKASSFINFTTSRKQLLERFSMFKPLHVGYIDSLLREDEGSTFHYLFIGVK